MTENTLLYRAQVAVEREAGLEHGATSTGDGNMGMNKRSSSTQDDTTHVVEGTTKKDKTPSNEKSVRDHKIKQFSIKRQDDKKNAEVGGILVLSQNIIIADNENKKLKLFDLSCNCLSSVDSKHHVWGITAVKGNLFATCGNTDTKVRLWTLRGKDIFTEDISYDVDLYSYGIHYNGTYYCVLHQWNNAITVMDTQGRQIRKIVRKEAFGKKIEFGGWDIHMDTATHNIYLPCRGDNSGALCLSVRESHYGSLRSRDV